jgi:glycine/D-amino acid oxidase-like deaminating enzyme
MTLDYLIIGQGIAGTWLSYYLQKANKSFLVIDNNNKDAPSRIAAGIINPVTGRRHVEVWMANEVLPFANEAYTTIGKELNITAISKTDIIDFFPSPQMRHSFVQRTQEKADYVQLPADEKKYIQVFNYEFGYGSISPVFTVHLDSLLPTWRQQLVNQQLLLEEEFDLSQLIIHPNHIIYKNITAHKIIFCDGSSSNTNPYFNKLPFAPNKGEALLLDIPDLPRSNIYKKGLSLVPIGHGAQWWIGSNYAWEFANKNPTEEFYTKTKQLLHQWLQVPFTITAHVIGIRPATLERRPFVGLHPQHPSIGILNGMGTKGCSLAPYFAQQLTHHLLHQTPITAEADIHRFTKTLSR